MNFKTRAAIIILGLLLLLCQGCRQEKEAEVDHLFNSFNGKDIPGAAVMVIKDSKPIFVKIYGLASLENNIPVKTNTNFRIASVTKQFTAMCILMLVERGKLTYDRTLTEIFPGFPDYGRNITIHHLLKHTSGLVAYESLVPETATGQILDDDVLHIIMSQDSTYFSPGAEYRYSNSGYTVLAMVVEKISGKSFAGFLKENIFEPLGMKKTLAYEKGISKIKHRAYGYAFEDSAFVFKDQSTISAVLGDGGIYSSTEDLYRWDQALYTGTLVTYNTLQRAFTPGVLNNGKQFDYGYGWHIDEYRGSRRIWHGGGSCGFRAEIQRYPDDKFTVIILTNRRKVELDKLAEKLTDLFLMGERSDR